MSRGWKPLHTSNHRAVSRTDRDRQPRFTVSGWWRTCGPRGIRPKVPFIPKRPVKPAGIRIDPPPSPPEAMGTRPPATAAAEPPEDPPGVLPCCHGLCVAPWRLVRVQLMPPNSDAVVKPTSTAPAARSRATWVLSRAAIRSAKTSEASVCGHPATSSSSLMPMGTPPKGRSMSAAAAAALAASSSR